MAETDQGLRAVQLEGKNMDSVECCVSECVCVCISVGGRGEKVERSEEDLGNKRTVSGVCRDAEATHECLRQPLTRTQTSHTYSHSTLSIIHISQQADVDSTRVKLQQSTHR